MVGLCDVCGLQPTSFNFEQGFGRSGSTTSTHSSLKGGNNKRLVITLPARKGSPKGLQSTKRQAYVDIPSAPYRIPRKRRRTSRYMESYMDDSSSLSSCSSHDQTVLCPIQMTLPAAKENSNSSSTLVSPISDDVRGSQSLAIEKSSSLETTNVEGNKTDSKYVKQVQPSTTSPLKFMKDQAAKKNVLSKLHFKKICVPTHEDVSISSPASNAISRADGDLPDPLNHDTQTHPTNSQSLLEGAQYFPPSEEISGLGDISHLLTQLAGETNIFSVRIHSSIYFSRAYFHFFYIQQQLYHNSESHWNTLKW